MPLKNNESHLEYKQRVIDTKSSSWCAAKYYNATIWLGSGQSTSCHHPPATRADPTQVKKTPALLHNTDAKKQDRQLMAKGDRPAGCEYCWKIEDMNRDAVSDRVYKTVIYTDEELNDAFKADPRANFNLKTLEIAFDRTCNFACSYCNPAFSTTWVNDIKKNGPYANLTTDGRGHYDHTHDHADPYKDQENPYVEAFFKWWETDLHASLQELRLTGGEPLMSPETWRLLDWFKQNNSTMRFAINSNLCAKDELIDRLIASTKNLPDFMIYTSNEAVGSAAEYIRDGLVWNQWTTNVERMLNESSAKTVHVMCTINALCLESLPEFMTWTQNLKRIYGKDRFSFNLNILRFPSFQSPTVLTNDLRMKFRSDLIQWLETKYDADLHTQVEYNDIRRLIDYLDVVQTPHAGAAEPTALRKDFVNFYQQYDRRRGKDFSDVFPVIFKGMMQ